MNSKLRLSIQLALIPLLGGGGYSLAAQDESLQIEEIIITAQKRKQSFNDVGIAVTAFTGQDIKDLRLAQPTDIAAQTPNLKINYVVANSIPNISIRGVGLNDYAANNNPAAGVYVDEVYLVSPAMLSFQLFDIERVEILKGPQGTLYGRNTTAGAINFVANKPGEDFDGSLSFDYGRYDHFAIEGFVSGQIAPGLNGRLALQSTQQSEGHQTNRLTGADVGEVDRTAWRAMLHWQASDQLDFVLNVHGGTDKSDIALIKIDNPFSAEDDGDLDVFRSGASLDTVQDIDSDGVTLTADWELSDRMTVTSITAYEELSRFHQEDRDATSLEQLDGIFINDIEQYSQELRLTYVDDEWVLILGAFFGNDEVATRDRFDAFDLLGLLGLGGTDSIGNEYRQETDSAALFAHSEWQLAAAWKLNAGLRYTSEDKKFSNAFTYLIAGGMEVQVFPAVANDYDVEDISGKIGIDYTGIENTLIYANISKGFKSGGFQGQLTFNPADLTAFEEETLLAYEAGFKTQLLGNSLHLNGAVFFYDYEDLQFYGGLFDSPVGTLFGITNVGDADITGAELDLWWKPMAGLDIRLGIGLLDTEITDSVVAGVAQGSELPNSPEFNFNGILRYRWNLTDGLEADVMLDTSYQDDVAFDIIRQPVEAQEEGYWLTNARIGVRASNQRWGAYLWAEKYSRRNLPYPGAVLKCRVW